MRTLRTSKPVEYYANIPLHSREFYLWDIRSMLERIYPENQKRFKIYSRICYYPMEKLVEIHTELFMSLLLDRPFKEKVLFMEYDRRKK